MNNRSFGPGVLTPIIKYIIIVNVAVFLFQQGAGYVLQNDFMSKLGLSFPLGDNFSPFQFITYMFVHGSFSHLLFNMFGLWMLGTVLEQVWGGKRFFTFYLLSGVGAAIFYFAIFHLTASPYISMIDDVLNSPSAENIHNFMKTDVWEVLHHFKGNAWVSNVGVKVVQDYESMLPLDDVSFVARYVSGLQAIKDTIYNSSLLVGASGSVYAILLAMGVMFPNSVIHLYFFIPIKMKYFVLGLGAISLIWGLMDRAGDNVAHFAHLGGMVSGLILMYFWGNLKKHP